MALANAAVEREQPSPTIVFTSFWRRVSTSPNPQPSVTRLDRSRLTQTTRAPAFARRGAPGSTVPTSATPTVNPSTSTAPINTLSAGPTLTEQGSPETPAATTPPAMSRGLLNATVGVFLLVVLLVYVLVALLSNRQQPSPSPAAELSVAPTPTAPAAEAEPSVEAPAEPLPTGGLDAGASPPPVAEPAVVTPSQSGAVEAAPAELVEVAPVPSAPVVPAAAAPPSTSPVVAQPVPQNTEPVPVIPTPAAPTPVTPALAAPVPDLVEPTEAAPEAPSQPSPPVAGGPRSTRSPFDTLQPANPVPSQPAAVEPAPVANDNPFENIELRR